MHIWCRVGVGGWKEGIWDISEKMLLGKRIWDPSGCKANSWLNPTFWIQEPHKQCCYQVGQDTSIGNTSELVGPDLPVNHSGIYGQQATHFYPEERAASFAHCPHPPAAWQQNQVNTNSSTRGEGGRWDSSGAKFKQRTIEEIREKGQRGQDHTQRRKQRWGKGCL